MLPLKCWQEIFLDWNLTRIGRRRCLGYLRVRMIT
uniref:Uncharacterized protein n=1 Tax=Brassica oleracea TaxID=3712 RepID=A0A3P6FYZ7_BRAOL|nr:unnamed protein product [Brassica oleracea]